MTPLWNPDPAADGLGPMLGEAGFTGERAARLLHAADPVDLLTNSALYAASAAGDLDGTLPGILTRLFVCNGEVSSAAYDGLVPARLRRALDDLRLLVRGAGTVRSLVSISPFASLYFLSDPLFRTRRGVTTMSRWDGLVMPPHASSLLLLDSVKPVGGRLLDVGCGSGFLAVALTDRYDSAVGVDVNPRAVGFSRANAAVNGRRAAFDGGDLTGALRIDPPADHVIFNSPSGPAHRADDRELGWMPAPTALEALAGRLPELLAQPGLAQILVIAELPREGPLVQLPPLPDGFSVADVAEFPDSLLGVSEEAIARGKIEPGCLLARDTDDAALLMAHLLRHDIRAVHPLLVTFTRLGRA